MSASQAAPVLEKELTPDLSAACDDLVRNINQLTKDGVKDRVRIGRRVNAIVADTTGRYGSTAEKDINKRLALSRDSIRAMRVAAALYTDAEVDAFLDLRHPTSKEGLNWTHMIVLTRVQDGATRADLTRQAAENGWSSKELNLAAIRAQGGARSRGGRPGRKFSTLAALLADVRAKTATCRNAATDSWLAQTGGLPDLCRAEVGNLAPQAVVDDLAATLADLDRHAVLVRILTAQVAANLEQAKASRVPRAAVA